MSDYFIAFLTTALAAGICFPFSSSIGYQTVGFIFLMTVSVLSLFLGRGPLVFVAILNFFVWNFFFITPLYTFRVHNLHDLIALFANLMVALVGSALISRIRVSQQTLLKSQERLTVLHAFLESLNNATSIKEVVIRAEEGLKIHFQAEIIIYIKEKSGAGLSQRPFGSNDLHHESSFTIASGLFLDPQNELSGNALDTKTGIKFHLLARIGVIGIRYPGGLKPDMEKEVLLKSFIAQIASALEREISIDLSKEKQINIESEKLFQTVLNSVSHELKTPISIISAAVSNLQDERNSADPERRRQIGEELEFASDRLNHLVENILGMSRIDSGLLKLNLQFCDVSDLIGIVVNELKANLSERKVTITTEEKLPLILADINLLKQALSNVLHNAIIYTKAGTPVSITASSYGEDTIAISVRDHGNGVPNADLHRLFDKFYRVPGSKSGGTGLGLTITKAIVEAHKGVVKAENAADGGLQITLYLKHEAPDGIAKE